MQRFRLLGLTLLLVRLYKYKLHNATLGHLPIKNPNSLHLLQRTSPANWHIPPLLAIRVEKCKQTQAGKHIKSPLLWPLNQLPIFKFTERSLIFQLQGKLDFKSYYDTSHEDNVKNEIKKLYDYIDLKNWQQIKAPSRGVTTHAPYACNHEQKC